jgi:hypothetical protein
MTTFFSRWGSHESPSCAISLRVWFMERNSCASCSCLPCYICPRQRRMQIWQQKLPEDEVAATPQQKQQQA